MNRKTVLQQIKTDLEQHLNSSNGYKSDPVAIYEGLSQLTDQVQRPYIGFLMTSDVKQEEYLGGQDSAMDDERERILTVIIYGQETVSYKDYEPLYDLIDDTEKFFMSSHWTYKDQTLLGDVSMWLNEVDFNQAYFTLELQIYYTQSL